MASTVGQNNALKQFFDSPLGSNLALGAGLALVLSIMGGVLMWGQKPEYRVLLSNYSDRDGGAILNILQQMNVPYEFAEGGGAIMVPADRVHDARLKLAAQGLPKGSNVGFELMENQKLGASQFLEQVNFQRALEGELSRSINSIAVVAASRVHLAIPKSSVFVREKQKPTASVLLNLHPGRTLDPQQVSAIVHLVSSSVPELPAQNVTVVDQNGNLLSDQHDANKQNRLDPNQLKYILDLQESIVKRIESILTPIVGSGNIRAEANADIDFSHTEQAAETFNPNNTVKRSEHTNQTSSSEPVAEKPSGIPGAASNQPGAPGQSAPPTPAPSNTQQESTINYEVDKTVRYVQQPMGTVKRLTVAVVLNNKTEYDAKGKPSSSRPLTDSEKEQITGLVKDAMGYNKDRGDSLNVVNTEFSPTPKEVFPNEPFWKPFATIENGKLAIQYLITAIGLFFLYSRLLKPLISRISATPQIVAPVVESPVMSEASTEDQPMGRTGIDVKTARKIASEDPRMVANVIKTWVNE